MNRVYYEMRNLGLLARERAINYAATNAAKAGKAISEAFKLGMELDRIDARRSPICAPGRDCWDVILVFFDPRHQLERAAKEYRITVDVSDTAPVMIGETRSWHRPISLR